jgi:hypothetical protein
MSEQQGRWVEPEVNYVHPERRFCAYCGRPIARRYWEAQDAEGETTPYCSPEHAERKATYLVNPGKAEGGISTANVPGT